jgi:hypothetical protein
VTATWPVWPSPDPNDYAGWEAAGSPGPKATPIEQREAYEALQAELYEAGINVEPGTAGTPKLCGSGTDAKLADPNDLIPCVPNRWLLYATGALVVLGLFMGGRR